MKVPLSRGTLPGTASFGISMASSRKHWNDSILLHCSADFPVVTT